MRSESSNILIRSSAVRISVVTFPPFWNWILHEYIGVFVQELSRLPDARVRRFCIASYEPEYIVRIH